MRDYNNVDKKKIDINEILVIYIMYHYISVTDTEKFLPT